jgi:trk system potassium uptake protein TrkH
MAIFVICLATFLLCIAERQTEFMRLFFEVVSAFGTVGLTTGITPGLSGFGKAVLIATMYIGRLGPLTVASIWIFKPVSEVSFAEESIAVG